MLHDALHWGPAIDLLAPLSPTSLSEQLTCLLLIKLNLPDVSQPGPNKILTCWSTIRIRKQQTLIFVYETSLAISARRFSRWGAWSSKNPFVWRNNTSSGAPWDLEQCQNAKALKGGTKNDKDDKDGELSLTWISCFSLFMKLRTAELSPVVFPLYMFFLLLRFFLRKVSLSACLPAVGLRGANLSATVSRSASKVCQRCQIFCAHLTSRNNLSKL